MATLTFSITTSAKQDAALARLLARANAENRINAPYAAVEPLLADLLIESIIEPAERQLQQERNDSWAKALNEATDKQRDDAAAILGIVPVVDVGAVNG